MKQMGHSRQTRASFFGDAIGMNRRIAALCALPLLFSAVGFGQLSVSGYQGATVSVWPDGEYFVNVPNTKWTFSGSTGAGTSNARIVDGKDQLGAWHEIVFDYS